MTTSHYGDVTTVTQFGVDFLFTSCEKRYSRFNKKKSTSAFLTTMVARKSTAAKKDQTDQDTSKQP